MFLIPTTPPKMNNKPFLNLLKLQETPIIDQLRFEEALIRCDSNNWCIINQGSSPAIVMGISGRPEQLINLSLLEKRPLQLIRRFSGGGTVIVDNKTIFVTIICNRDAINIPLFPKHISQWMHTFYRPVFNTNKFQLIDHDYTLENRKFGGNAQYIRKDRWLHHSSLLWDYDPNMMNYLLPPPKMPSYRKERSHEDFLCRLKDHLASPHHLIHKINQQLQKAFQVIEVEKDNFPDILQQSHRKSTQEICVQENHCQEGSGIVTINRMCTSGPIP